MLSPLGEPELRQLWRRGFIYGFISRAGAEKLLQPTKVPLGTFLVRFSGESSRGIKSLYLWKYCEVVAFHILLSWRKETRQLLKLVTTLEDCCFLTNKAIDPRLVPFQDLCQIFIMRPS